MRISTRNARLIRGMILNARHLERLYRTSRHGLGGVEAYYTAVGQINNYYARNRKTLDLWWKVRGGAGN